MTTKNSDSVKSVLVIFLEDRHRELVQSQFSGSLASREVDSLYRAFLDDTIAACLGIGSGDVVISTSAGKGRKIVDDAVVELPVCLKGKSKSRFEQHGIELWPQPEAGLSENLRQTFEKCFSAGYQRVLLIDCVTPTISHRMLNDALQLLEEKDVVFGPTLEGSYYLLGMRRLIPEIFSRIDWSKGDHIYSRIVELACDEGLDWEELELWYDLRQSGDLEFLARDINAFRIVGDETSAKRTETVLESLIKKLQGEES
jgi:glycosyltransferase A (GT-A) superfamily protein (DUF2064 family)